MQLDEIKSDFELLDEWEDRYRYVIELGRKLPDLDPALKTDATKVRGCASQVWLITTPESVPKGTGLAMQGESDAHIVQGLIAILFAIYDDKTIDEIIDLDAEAVFSGLGLKEHLTPQRSNGLASMIKRIRADADALRVA